SSASRRSKRCVITRRSRRRRRKRPLLRKRRRTTPHRRTPQRPPPKRPKRRRTRSMFTWLANAWRVPELRRRGLFTAGVLAVYKLGTWLPAPGISPSATGSSNSGVGAFLNLLSGGGLSRGALFAVGIQAYVTSSIILQLLAVAVPSLERLQKEGEV